MKPHLALLAAWLLATLAAAPAPSLAQPASPRVEGRTLEGRPFQLSSLRGKVVLLMFWSTDCAVCRDKMPELRQNYAGWRGKPFELVLVSTDRRMADLQAYDGIISRTVPLDQRFVQLWVGDASYKDSLGTQAPLPASYLIDRAGRVVERYQGRIPPEAWDRIAELLP